MPANLSLCKVVTKHVCMGGTVRVAACQVSGSSVQIGVYNGAVHLWQAVRRELAAAIELTGGGGSGAGGGSVWRMFWSVPFSSLCSVVHPLCNNFTSPCDVVVQVGTATLLQAALCLIENTDCCGSITESSGGWFLCRDWASKHRCVCCCQHTVGYIQPVTVVLACPAGLPLKQSECL